MSKKFIFVLVGIVFFFGFKLANAGVIINEIQLSPTDGRFIELYNSDSSSLDLTGWYIQRKTLTGTTFSSLVSNPNFENKSIGANGYFLISRSSMENADIILSNLTLTESNTIQIKNSAGEVVDKVAYGDADESVAANPSEGQSIQRNSSNSWTISSPTPRVENSSSGNNNTNNTGEENDNTDTGTNEESSSDSNTTEETTIIKNPTMKAKILTKTLAFIGQPLEFNSSIVGYSNENVVLGKIFWNFGDGSSFEQVNNFSKFNHFYFYEGEYPVSMEYYSNQFSDTPDAVNKIIIKVVPMTVSISKVGDAKDFFVELTNNSNYEIDISKWILNANGKVFVFPKNSVIMSKKQMIVSGKITGFIKVDEKNLKLISSTGEIVFDYNSLFSQEEIVAKPVTVKTYVKNNAIEEKIEDVKDLVDNQIQDEILDQAQITGNDLSATALLGDTENKDTNNYLFFGIFGALIVLVGIGVYFIRRKGIRANIQDGSDFKILDE